MQYPHQTGAAHAQHAAQQRQSLPAASNMPQQQPQPNISQSISAKYEVMGKIGEGTYGVVYLARSKDGNKSLYAIKTFKTAREGDGISPTAIREIMLLRELKHESIVRLNSVHINRQEPSLSLAFDYAEYDLYEMIRHHRDKLQCLPMDPYMVKSIMWQLLNGLNYLHQNWIIHRDLKPSNVLVMGEGEECGLVKIADFGLARIFQSPLRPLSDNGVVVTIWYRAPELLLGAKHYTRAVDVWAAGCIWGELLMLKPLFQGSEKKQAGNPFQADQLDKVFRVLSHPTNKAWPLLDHLAHWHDNTDNVRLRKEEWKQEGLENTLLANINQLNVDAPEGKGRVHYKPGPLLLDLLKRMLEFDPAKRITAEQAMEHPYFMEEPRPSPNVLLQGKKLLHSYPRRIKYNFRPAPEAPNPAAQGAMAAANAPQAPNRIAASSGAMGMTRKRKADFAPRMH